MAEVQRPRSNTLLSSSAVLGDVHDLVLEDEEIRRAFARQAHHISVVVLDPAAHNLTIHELNRHRLLLFSQRFEKGRLFESVFWRRRPATLDNIGISLSTAERHGGIVLHVYAKHSLAHLFMNKNGLDRRVNGHFSVDHEKLEVELEAKFHLPRSSVGEDAGTRASAQGFAI